MAASREPENPVLLCHVSKEYIWALSVEILLKSSGQMPVNKYGLMKQMNGEGSRLPAFTFRKREIMIPILVTANEHWKKIY